MTTPNQGKAEYLQGISHWEDFLKSHNVASWANAMNSLQDALASPHLSRRSAADAHYKTGLLWLFDSQYEMALDRLKTCLSISRQAFVHDAIGHVYGALGNHEESAFPLQTGN